MIMLIELTFDYYFCNDFCFFCVRIRPEIWKYNQLVTVENGFLQKKKIDHLEILNFSKLHGLLGFI